MSFEKFCFHPEIMAGIRASNYVDPTPIQEQAIPPILEGKDVLGLAQTGTGKTAAFALPILQRLRQGERKHVRALVLAPTRELAEQIHEAIRTLGKKTRVSSMTLYGGVNIRPQIQSLKKGVEVVVACPGRLLDHIAQGTIRLSNLEVLVLDEADQMFDMGFLPDIRRILQHLPRQRQTLLFGATMPAEIRGLAREILADPVTIQVGKTAPVAHGLPCRLPGAAAPEDPSSAEDSAANADRFRPGFHPDKAPGPEAGRAAVESRLPGDLAAGRSSPKPPPGSDGRVSRRFVPHPRRHRYRGAGNRRFPDFPRNQLRCSRHGGSVHPPHRPNRSGLADGGRLYPRSPRGRRDDADH